ncbi:MAG: hypothetical protein KUG70_03375 [Rhodobacteraceae bacterium]|nr:hypothetical protein [Paracoccaceae bacterium]
MMHSYEIIQNGASRSFPTVDDSKGDDPKGDEFLTNTSGSGDILIYLGDVPQLQPDDTDRTVLIELDLECLGVHTGEASGTEGSDVLGFARYRNGNDAPGRLIELVRQPQSSEAAITAARQMFEAAGFDVVVALDRPGRIIDRLVRPQYNAAMRFLDDGLASAEAMDMTSRMGLGYPDGLIERTQRGDLERHYDISKAIYDMTGLAEYAPSRMSCVAKQRKAE